MSANELIIEYVAMCEKYGQLDFDAFIEVWITANAIAKTFYSDISADEVKKVS